VISLGEVAGSQTLKVCETVGAGNVRARKDDRLWCDRFGAGRANFDRASSLPRWL